MSDLPTRLERLAGRLREHGGRRTAGWLMRLWLFPPATRREALFLRRIRPIARKLLPRRPADPALPATTTLWSHPHASLLQHGPIARILLLKLDHIGDFLLAAASFGLIRHSFPDAHITLLCGPWNLALAQASGWFDRIVPLSVFAAESQRPARLNAAMLRPLALGDFDLAVDLRLDDDTRVLLRHVTARATAGYWAPTMPPTMAVVLPLPSIDPNDRHSLRGHQSQLMLTLATAIVTAFAPSPARALLDRAAPPAPPHAWRRPVVAMNTGSGRAIKNWPRPRFEELGRWVLEELGGTLVLLGGRDQRDDARALRENLPHPHLIDLVGQLPLDRSLAILREADCFVGNDSALGHASAALGRPTVVVFSGIDPLPSWAPLGPRAVAVKAEIACSPCHLSDLAECPNGHGCLTGISVAQIRTAITAVTASTQAA